ncbi:MAG: nitroimidazol reductase NimA-like FMN-containing flavoprotein [Halobacteriales archaeon]|jgi:nitroimidazol reductase NimA-like FMN-containing flavoprotein (pyridoxamine 5'-phosphate oxidase superfamily)
MVDSRDTRVRRDEYAVDDEKWMREFLAAHPAGVLGTVDDGQPFLTPLLFAHDAVAEALFVHLSPEGRTLENVAGNPRVAFSVFEMGRIVPGVEAGSFDNEYASVTLFGAADLLERTRPKHEALAQLMAKYAPHLEPGEDYRPSTSDAVTETAVIEVAVEDWSAKRKTRPDDDGYRFGEVSER